MMIETRSGNGAQRDTEMTARIRADLKETIAVTQACLDEVTQHIAAAARIIVEALAHGGKIVLFGNGGSAAQAQHLAADFVGTFARPRPAIPAVALTTDTSVITAVGNDLGFDQLFARQVEALVGGADVIIALSTSGASVNVLRGTEAARKAGARIIALTGGGGGALARLADVAICVPSDSMTRIQEAHAVIGHVLCTIVEDAWAREAP